MRDSWDETFRRQPASRVRYACSCARAVVALVVLLLTGLTAGGCGGGATGSAQAAADGPPQHGGKLVVSASKEPPIINPWLAPGAMAITWILFDGVSDPLVTLDEQGRWQPVLATSVPTIANGGVQRTAGGGMTVAFDLRPNASWSDGVPIRCEDVAFTWQTVVNPEHQMSNRLGWDQIEAVDCPTPRHVAIRMKTRYALYMSRILATPPLPAHELRGKDFNSFWNGRITVSSGPFLFVEWQRGVKLVLRRNPRYWNAGAQELPYLDRVTFRFTKDANTLKMQLRMTEADAVIIPADTNLVEELKATPDIEFAAPPGALVELLAFQTRRPPLDDVRVRQAVAYAIDRRMITDVVLRGQVPPMQQTMVPTQPVYRSAAFERYGKPDPDKVRALLGEAGWQRSGKGLWHKDGEPLELEYVAAAGSYPFRAKVGQLLQQQLLAQGIGVSIQLITPELLYTQVAPKGNYHIGEWSEATGIEPAPALLFGCDQIPKKPAWAGKNRFRWCHPEVDELMRQADTVVDAGQRAALLRKVDERVAEELPVLPLMQSPDTIAWSVRLQGVRPNPPVGHTWNIGQWWLAGQEDAP